MRHFTSHHQRILTAAVLVPLLAWVLMVGGLPLLFLVLIASGLGLWEFYTLFFGRRHDLFKALGVVCGTIILTACYFGHPWWAGGALLTTFWTCNLLFLALSSRSTAPSYALMAVIMAGQFYLPLLLQFAFRFSSTELFFLLVLTFASDTGAFYAGTLFGGKKIWPSVSPKKTWAGSIGGLFACASASVAFGAFAGTASWPVFLLAGVVLNLAAQFGDFFESALKRSLNVKDSGKILPGHGGILDRIDSLLLVVPAYALLRVLFVFFA